MINEKLTSGRLSPEKNSHKKLTFFLTEPGGIKFDNTISNLMGLFMESTVDKLQGLNGVLELIGRKLTDLRVKKGYASCFEFAMAHNLPPAQYRRMENGKVNMTFKSLHKVVSIHGLTLEQLFVEIVTEGNNISIEDSE